MKEVIFRVWDGQKFIMPPHKYSSIIGGNFFTLDGRCYINGVYQDLILQQYIGIKDIKGTKIYEGDILGYGDNYECEVVYDEEQCMFLAKEYKNKDGIRYHQMDAYTTPWEILGNIFETPELLRIERKV